MVSCRDVALAFVYAWMFIKFRVCQAGRYLLMTSLYWLPDWAFWLPTMVCHKQNHGIIHSAAILEAKKCAPYDVTFKFRYYSWLYTDDTGSLYIGDFYRPFGKDVFISVHYSPWDVSDCNDIEITIDLSNQKIEVFATDSQFERELAFDEINFIDIAGMRPPFDNDVIVKHRGHRGQKAEPSH